MSTLPLPQSSPERDSDSLHAEHEVLRIRGENRAALAVAIRRAAHLVLLALIPPGFAGIAVGASAVVLNLAAPSVHLLGLLIIWTSTTIVSVMALVVGMLEARDFNRVGPADPDRDRR